MTYMKPSYGKMSTAPIVSMFTVAGTNQSPAYTVEPSPLAGRKGVLFRNQSEVDIEVCNTSNSPAANFTLKPWDQIGFRIEYPNSPVVTFKYLSTGTVSNAIQRIEWK
jgi:hypothetical protein